ncbi:MAG: ParA family protein [Lachnospiraceae bacterium]
MKTISIINLKGGCAKSTTAINMSALLAEKHGKSVLLIDNDPQGNTSQFFGAYDEESLCGSAEILTNKEPSNIWEVMEGIDLIDANMTLLEADNEIRSSAERQDNRITSFLEKKAADYDYCIIDNPPAILMCTINALCASDEVIVPVTLDNWALDGVDVITEQIEGLRALNTRLKISGILLTNYKKSPENEMAEKWLRENCPYRVYDTRIRRSDKAVAATYYKKPLELYSPRSAAAVSYRRFVREYLEIKEGR